MSWFDVCAIPQRIFVYYANYNICVYKIISLSEKFKDQLLINYMQMNYSYYKKYLYILKIILISTNSNIIAKKILWCIHSDITPREKCFLRCANSYIIILLSLLSNIIINVITSLQYIYTYHVFFSSLKRDIICF